MINFDNEKKRVQDMADEKPKGKTLSEAEVKIAVAGIAYFGDKMILPEGMSLDEAAKMIERRKKFEQEDTVMAETFPVFPFDGAVSLDNVLREKFGWAEAVKIPGFFGDTPPAMMNIEVGPGIKRMVPWGRFVLPTIKGFIQTGAEQKGGQWHFQLNAKVARKDEERIKELFALVRKEITKSSIYRGKAIKLRFKDDDGEPAMPEPKFLDTSTINPEMLVFSESTMRSIQTNLYTPITRVDDCLRNGIPVKRGVLLGGTFGTGKTMAAAVASKLAVEHGVTYVYVPRADELKQAIEFATQYQSPACVVFCEDIDRVTAGERNVEMDDILNIIDGIDSKNSHIIVVLTTNNLESIHPAMLRPGRLDAVIPVTAPDAKAVEKLIRLYGGGAVAFDTDLTRVGEVLQGHIPAIISEVVKRAKLSELTLLEPGKRVTQLSEDALLEAAQTMTAQMGLLEAALNEQPAEDTLELALIRAVRRAQSPIEEAAQKGAKADRAIKARLGI